MDLPAIIAEASERSQLAGLAPRGEHLTRLAEAELNKRLTIAAQEATITLTTDVDGLAPLPGDFLTMRRASIGGKELRQWSLGDIQSGARSGYAVRGNTLISTEKEQPVLLNYYRGLPPLSLDDGEFDAEEFSEYEFAVDQTTNWLAESDPEIYIMAVLKHWFMFKATGARGAEGGELRQKAIDTDGYLDLLIERRNSQDIRTRFGEARFRTAGPCP